jgi:hypothetical protein
MLISNGNSLFELAAAVNLGASLVPTYLAGLAQRQLERIEVQRVIVRSLPAQEKRDEVEDILSSAGFSSRTAIQELKSKEISVRNTALLFVTLCVGALLLSALRPDQDVNDVLFVFVGLFLLVGCISSLYFFTFSSVRTQLKLAEGHLGEAGRVLKA